MKIIGINGFKRAGKGETAAAIERFYPGNVTHLGFAYKVKVFAALCLGFSRDRSDEELIALMDEAKEHWIIDVTDQATFDNISAKRPQGPFHDLTGRQYLQEIGTRARQMFGDDFWVDQVLPKAPGPPAWADALDRARLIAEQLDDRYPSADAVVFSDVRFENEAERVLALDGEVWRVHRPGCGSDGHASEQKLPDSLVTRELYNTGSLVDLEAAVVASLAKKLA